MASNDPYPWVTTDENGAEFRTHTAHADGVDENGVEWEGWRYEPRSDAELEAAGEIIAPFSELESLADNSDPYPWVTIDMATGEEFRTHTAHEDGVDENGNVWEGWTYAPRSAAELAALECA